MPPYVKMDVLIRRLMGRLPHVPFKLLINLGSRINQRGQCWPSYARLEEDLQISRRPIREGVDWLEKHRFVTISRGRGRGHPNVYTLAGLFTYGVERVREGPLLDLLEEMEREKGNEGDPIEAKKGNEGDPIEAKKGNEGDPIEAEKGNEGDPIPSEPGDPEKGHPSDPFTLIKGSCGGPLRRTNVKEEPIPPVSLTPETTPVSKIPGGTKEEHPFGAHTEASKLLFDKTGRHRWQNKAQREAFEKCEVDVGTDIMTKAVTISLVRGKQNIPYILGTARGMKEEADGRRPQRRSRAPGKGARRPSKTKRPPAAREVS